MPLQMVMSRNRIVRTLSGHTIQFVKNEPTMVPDLAAKECFAFGAALADGQELPPAAEAALDADLPKVLQDQPKDAADRKKRILAVMKDMIANQESHRMHFAASGRPRARYVTEVLGFDVTTQEIEEHWNTLTNPMSEDDAI
jgi:hypothetical protein